MDMQTLHEIIDEAQRSNPEKEFTVCVVNEAGERMKVYIIEEVFVDKGNSMVSLIINTDKAR